MNDNGQGGIGLISTGRLLASMVECLGISKEELGFKDLELLGKGGLSAEKEGEVMLAVMRAIVSLFFGADAAETGLVKVLKEKTDAPVRRIAWQRVKHLMVPVPEYGASSAATIWRLDSEGHLHGVREHLLHDWTEFLLRHNWIANQCGVAFPATRTALQAWIFRFVVPFVAVNLVEYQGNHSQLERGMPAGRLWYLPYPTSPPTNDRFLYKLPFHQVLEWWEDLLGAKLYEHAPMLCATGSDPDIARREIRAWRCEDKPPKLTTILRWCGADWSSKYKGTFSDDLSLPLAERWQRCRDYLKGKGLANFEKNWIAGASGPHVELLRKQYRGELLELQILPFKEMPFAAFFQSRDPVAEGLPIEQLIERVSERFARPSNGQLRARLVVAAATQRAFRKMEQTLGNRQAFMLLGLFQEVYSFLQDLYNQAARIKGEDMLTLLRRGPEEQKRLAVLCEWLFDEQGWRELPNEISELVRGASQGP